MKMLTLTTLALLALPGLLSAWHEPSPPFELVSVPAGAQVKNFWPYTGVDYSAAPKDPINLVFVGEADPRLIRQTLLALDGDRTAFGFPNAFPFDCTWADAIGRPQTGYSEDAGWQGSGLQLECGDYATLRVHLRLFRHGEYTLGGAHFDALIPGTTSHEVLAWDLPQDFVTIDLLRSGLLAASELTPQITPSSTYRSIRELVFEGVPLGLRAALGLPLAPPPGDVPIPNRGMATVLRLGGVLDPVSSDVVVEFDHPFDQTIPKPFCAEPWDFLKAKGTIHMVHRVRTNPSGKYTSRFLASGVLQVTPIDGRSGAVGETYMATVSEIHRSGLTDRRQVASMTAVQVLLAHPAQSLFEKLWAGSVKRYLRRERCGF